MKQVKLTSKQELVLNYIKEYTAVHGYPPAVREIAKGVGLNSPSSVHSHIKRLEKNGFLKKTNSKFRTLEVVGINEFTIKNEESVAINTYSGINNYINNLLNKDNSFMMPSSRIPKNYEIFAIIINKQDENFIPGDILIIQKIKSFKIKDTLLLFKDDKLSLRYINKKEEKIESEYKIIGKIIELNRKY